jgi:hypothetical protein
MPGIINILYLDVLYRYIPHHSRSNQEYPLNPQGPMRCKRFSQETLPTGNRRQNRADAGVRALATVIFRPQADPRNLLQR